MRTKLLWIGADLAVIDPKVHGALYAAEILAESALAAGVARLKTVEFDAIVLSASALSCSVDQALEELYGVVPHIPLIVHYPSGTIADVIAFTRRGAYYVLLGELNATELAEVVAKAGRKRQAKQRPDGKTAPWRQFLIGESPAMRQVCEIIELVAAKRCTVLITGETGTGKEVIAKAIHAASNRAQSALVSVNCTALPANLIETELFGHAKGAFTGAHASRMGRFEQAHRGTIFLDEIGDLPLEAQAKLLRVLQEQEFQRVGSSETVRVDVRVIAASNVDLEKAVRERRFREDLYYRLNVVPVHLLPLRERREDIPYLLEHFLEKIRSAENAPPKQISDEGIQYLSQLTWPGNVRQLEHAVQMAFAMSGERRLLYPGDFVPRKPAGAGRGRNTSMARVEIPQQGLNFDEVVSAFELSLLNQALALSGGNKARAADLLQIKRTTLLAKMKSFSERANGVEHAASQAPSAALSEVKTPPSRRTALVLEMDGPIRSLVSRTLEQEGFRVLHTGSASEALDLVDCWKSQIALLVAPHELPSSNARAELGVENLVASCRRCASDMGVILLSAGHSEARSTVFHARTRHLPCPFSSGDLLQAIHSLGDTTVAEVCEEACA